MSNTNWAKRNLKLGFSLENLVTQLSAVEYLHEQAIILRDFITTGYRLGKEQDCSIRPTGHTTRYKE
ncbi:MAG: hypothetical protein VX086_06175 [Pseudomonadota bacterium]|nr:hypothetical protein [Pseudomonadota bacterium]